MYSEGQGKVKAICESEKGQTQVILNNVLYVPNGICNVISEHYLWNNGTNVPNVRTQDHLKLFLEKGKIKLIAKNRGNFSVCSLKYTDHCYSACQLVSNKSMCECAD